MSAAATTAATPAAPAKGKKKLIVIIAVAVLVLALGGVGALLLLKKSTAVDDDEEADTPEHRPAVSQRASGSPPVFAPLEPFTVNLADKDADRYAQVGITLEMTDQAAADSLKAFMPAIRNNVLMLLAHKTSSELMGREGKELLAREVRRETARGLGFDLPDVDEQADDEEDAPKKKKRKSAEPELPILAVYFSTFIIQ